MDEIIIEDGKNIISSKAYKKRHIVARFEESNIQPNQLPYYLFPTFQEILVTQKGCVELDGFFDCSEKKEIVKNFKVSYVFGGNKYVMNTNSIWFKNKLFFKFNKENGDNFVIIYSSFSGNFHRIYSMDDQRVYFSGINNNIVKLDDNSKANYENKNENKDEDKYEDDFWFIISMMLIFILIIIIIVLFVKMKNKNDFENNVIEEIGQNILIEME